MHVIEDLPTPCVLIDQTRMEQNLSRVSVRSSNVQIRPHTKTHKSIELAKRQESLGAEGITVAKVSEAEKFINHGFTDVRIAYPIVGTHQLESIVNLSDKAHISFCIDTIEGAQCASSLLSKSGVEIDVLIEIDTGYGRCGVLYDHDNVINIASRIQELDGLRLCGILTHEGNAYAANDLEHTMAEARDRMLDVANRLHEALSIDPDSFEISMGSTPSISVFKNKNKGPFQITELRPGNYIFNDLTQVMLGVCSLDECALTVLSTVVSHHRTSMGTERFILDAGRKVLTSDLVAGNQDYGCILYNPRTRTAHPHARITGLSEEHGWGAVQGGSTFTVGDKVQIIPNHACVVVNMVDLMYMVHESEILSTITVDTRGCVI
ncbi:MAG: alanine racemase [Bacteroidetes bacterium]|nr:alanine racemase [Bacteroidota bacterium]